MTDLIDWTDEISGNVVVTGTVTISGPVVVTGAVTVTGIVAISGTVTVTGTVAISGTVTVTGAVTVTGTVAISGTVTVTGAVTVTGTVAISGTVTVSGAVTVTGSVSITGTVTITGAVTITSGTINIQTGAGTNIIIDKLTQDSRECYGKTVYPYVDTTEQTADPTLFNSTYRRGVLWRRGCAGLLREVWVYLKNNTAGPLTRYLSLYPFAGAAAIATLPFTIAGNTAGWVNYLYYTGWLYDSLLIGSDTDFDANLQIGYWDEPSTTGNGVANLGTGWLSAARVPAIKVVLAGVGRALPVNGMVTAVLLCDESKKQGGLWGVGDWSAYKGTDKNLHTYGLNKVFGDTVSATYTVPAGKTLYITSFSVDSHANAAASGDLNQIVIGELQAGATVLIDIGGNGGANITLSKPFAVAAGVVVTFLAHVGANHASDVDVTVVGYEV